MNLKSFIRSAFVISALGIAPLWAGSDHSDKNDDADVPVVIKNDQIPQLPLEEAINKRLFAFTPGLLTIFTMMMASQKWDQTQMIGAALVGVAGTLLTYQVNIKNRKETSVKAAKFSLLTGMATVGCAILVAQLLR